MAGLQTVTTGDVAFVSSGMTGASEACCLAADEGGKGLEIVMLEVREACGHGRRQAHIPEMKSSTNKADAA